MSLYGDSRAAAIAEAGKAVADGKGVEPAKLAQLQKGMQDLVLPEIQGRPNLSAAQAAGIAKDVVRQVQKVATGKVSEADLIQGKQATLAAHHHKYGIGGAAKMSAALGRLNSHMREHEPRLHAGMNAARTPQLAGIGNNPRLVGILLEEQRLRDENAAKAKYATGWISRERAKQAADAVHVPHGILGGKDV